MTRISHAEAIVDALYREMESDPTVSLIGSHVLGLGPQRPLIDRVREAFPDRVLDPPIAESAAVAVGIGAAMTGKRPFVDIGSASFVFEAWSQLVNEAGPARYMSGGQISTPVVFHMLHGLRGGGAAQHSASPHSMMWNAPGLEIALPASPRDAKGLITTAIRSENPTVVLDHASLLGLEDDVPDGEFTIPFGVADIKREGADATIVAISRTVRVALEAADTLATEGVECEVVDPRTLVPFDRRTVLDSVAKTGRLIVVDESNLSCGAASEIAAIVAEEGFASLKAPIRRVARPDVPTPFSAPLEARITPDAERVADAVRRTL